MPVNINASTSAGIGITPDNSGVIQFQSNGANTVQIAANGTMTNANGTFALTSQIPTGALIRAPQVLTSGTSYTTPAGCTAIYVEALGGGGGGGSKGTSAGQIGGSGAAGAYTAKYFTVTGNTSYTYAIGAGGVGSTTVSGGAGTAGGNTTFTVGGTTVTATGGTGGAAGSTTTTKITAGVTSTNGDINFASENGFALASGGFRAGGSASPFGAGAISNDNGNGSNATGYGSGGTGGFNSTTAQQNGANGTQGFIRITEYT